MKKVHVILNLKLNMIDSVTWEIWPRNHHTKLLLCRKYYYGWYLLLVT